MRFTAFTISTVFGAGYWPWGPGTAGSVAAIVGAAAFLRGGFASPATLWIWVFAGLVPAVWASEQTRRCLGREDPQIVVVDELLGQWITLAALPTLTLPGMAAALILFRTFDIVKPWPVRWLEELPGGWGIIADDLMAGLYGAAGILLLRPLL